MPFVDNNGVRIYYEVEGRGMPLMMVHGLGNSTLEYRLNGYVEPLSETYQVILVDVRGHGRSDKPHKPEAYRAELVAQDLVAILDELGIATTHYWGYSMGSAIGWYAMVPHARARLCSLIFGGGPRDFAEERLPHSSAVLKMWEHIAEVGMPAGLAYLEARWGPIRKPFRSAQLANDPHAVLAMVRALHTWPRAPEDWARCDLPALIYAGDRDEAHDGAASVAASLSNARFISLPGLDHIGPQRHPELVLPHVLAFLAEVDKSDQQPV
ncbi:MAG: alpha/beta hydrolase [Chloroflexi bacterium]|nr:alpha/beta hydrolase [Chloroflexota bacterium]